MSDPAAAPSSTDVVDRAYQLRSEIAALQTQLDQVEQNLIKLGRGDYAGTDPSNVAKVIVPSAPEPSYKLEAANEARAREIAGQRFADVFVRKVVFLPCKAFAEVAEKLLTPARHEKLLALCRVERATQSPYVKFA